VRLQELEKIQKLPEIPSARGTVGQGLGFKTRNRRVDRFKPNTLCEKGMNREVGLEWYKFLCFGSPTV